jgi:hypothetical protein
MDKIDEKKYWEEIHEITDLMRRMGESIPDIDKIKNRFQIIVEEIKPPFLIKEGLISTYDINYTTYSIAELFNLQNSELDKDKNFDGKIWIKSGDKNDIIKIELYDLSNINNINFYMKKYGWICSEQNKNIFTYEKKFDSFILAKRLILDNNQFLYHITTKNLVNKIMKQGLIPKNKVNGFIDNEERNYFFLKQPTKEKLKDFYFYKLMEPVVLLKIDLSKINPSTKFYYDPRIEDSLYVYEPIPNNAIEIIDEYEK